MWGSLLWTEAIKFASNIQKVWSNAQSLATVTSWTESIYVCIFQQANYKEKFHVNGLRAVWGRSAFIDKNHPKKKKLNGTFSYIKLRLQKTFFFQMTGFILEIIVCSTDYIASYAILSCQRL